MTNQQTPSATEVEQQLKDFREMNDSFEPSATVDDTLTVERAGAIALTLVNKNMSASETAFFVAGFQECIKYLHSQQLQSVNESLHATLEKYVKEHAIMQGEIERLKEYEWKYKELCK